MTAELCPVPSPGACSYAFSFGLELTLNNLFAQYLYDEFNTTLTQAGALASIFSLFNLVARPAGGWLSDRAAHRWGMRGRLWVLFTLQSTAAAFCCGLSAFSGSLGGTMSMAVCMALATTAASGATFGIGERPSPLLLLVWSVGAARAACCPCKYCRSLCGSLAPCCLLSLACSAVHHAPRSGRRQRHRRLRQQRW